MTIPVKQVLLKDFKPECLLNLQPHPPERPRFPVIDAHNHLFGELPAEKLIEVMDAVGVKRWLNVTGNVTMPLENNTYTIARRPLDVFLDKYVKRYPGRFAAFSMADFAQWGDPVLLKDDDWVRRCIEHFDEDLAKGACGLKVTKELGLYFRDRGGEAGEVAGDQSRRLDQRRSRERVRCGRRAVLLVAGHGRSSWRLPVSGAS